MVMVTFLMKMVKKLVQTFVELSVFLIMFFYIYAGHAQDVGLYLQGEKRVKNRKILKKIKNCAI